MKRLRLVLLSAMACTLAHADFSYTTTTKNGMGDNVSKHYLKGNKIVTDTGNTTTIMDLDAGTMTTVNKAAKTFSVMSFADMGKTVAGMNITEDFKKTGQRQNINGFDAEELVISAAMDSSQMQGRGGKNAPPMQMKMEMHIWVSADVPGIEEMQKFYAKNADKMPWAAMAGGNSNMAEMQRKIAAMHGVPVRTVMKMGSANPQQEAQMEQARAKIEEMKKQGGPQAAMADQILAKMGGGVMSGVVSDSSGFSSAPVPDSVFAIPADYKKVDK